MTPTAPRIVSNPETSSRGFVARLQGASLGDLIQMECLRGARQVVCVSSGPRIGYFFFDQGQVIHASTGEHFGEAAVFEMMSWTDGTIVSVDRPWPLRPTIQTGWQMLLIEAMRRGDESRRDSAPDSGEAALSYEPPGQAASRVAETRGRAAPPARRYDGPSGAAGKKPPGLVRGAVPLETAEENAGASESAASRYGLRRAVRVDEEGQTISALGEVGDLADVASYAARLARLIGATLGLEEFIGLECKTPERNMLIFPDGETLVALEAEASSNIEGYRKRAGL